MQIAINKDTGERIHAVEEAKLGYKRKYICPVCGEELIFRNGHILIPHFAHKAASECDTFSVDMSEWHIEWQEEFPAENQEIVFTKEMSEYDYNLNARYFGFDGKSEDRCPKEPEGSKTKMLKLIHRADVVVGDWVVEFQQPILSRREFAERNWFFNKCGKRVLWIFDYRNEYRIKMEPNTEGWQEDTYHWHHPQHTFASYFPQDHTDEEDVVVLFQIDEKDQKEYLMRLTSCKSVIDRSFPERTNEVHPLYTVFKMIPYPKNLEALKEYLNKKHSQALKVFNCVRYQKSVENQRRGEKCDDEPEGED